MIHFEDDVESRVRAELNRRAEHAPTGTLLAEQILAAARRESRPARRRGWSTWTLPLLAAGAVAAIVAGVLVGVAQLRHVAAPPLPTRVGTGGPSGSQLTPSPTTRSATPTTRPSQTRSSAPAVPDNPVGLNAFALKDVTFFGTEDGWALGTADCLSGPGTCPAMVRTTDGGRSWHSMPQPPGGVTGIRFATPEIGYAFDASVLEMTTNGGKSWSRQSGGAIALETLDGNAVRLVASSSDGCPGPCGVRAEYAAIGSPKWADSDLGPLDGGGFQLVRSGTDVYVLLTRNTAGGADARSTLYASRDDGAHWHRYPEPCPQRGGEVDSYSIAASPGDAVTALCVPRASRPEFVAVSHDAGASFGPRTGTLPWRDVSPVVGDPATVLVTGDHGAYRSTDGGTSWVPIRQVTGTVSFLGFESTTLGRIVTDGGRTIWTTRDGGAHWSRYTFPS